MSRTIEPFFICATQDFTRGNTTVTNLLNQQLAGLAQPAVAHLAAGVFSTVEHSAAHLVTLKDRGLAAAHRLTGPPTDAGFSYKGRALWARSRVAQDVTRVVAIHSAPLLPTHVTAAVGDLTALPLWVGHFATEAGVGSRVFQCNILAGRTTPTFSRIVCLRGWGSGPLLDAVQMEDMEATLAAPHRSHEPDNVTTHHALVLLFR